MMKCLSGGSKICISLAVCVHPILPDISKFSQRESSEFSQRRREYTVEASMENYHLACRETTSIKRPHFGGPEVVARDRFVRVEPAPEVSTSF